MTDTERLLSLNQADPGFYILAIHAYIEKTLKIKYPGIEDSVFWRMMDEYKSILINKGSSAWGELEFIYSLKREHSLTNRVRHQFEVVSKSEAKGSTWNFLRFLKMEGMEGTINTDKIRKLLQDWDRRDVPVDEEAFIALKYQFIKLKKEHESFLERYEQYKEAAELDLSEKKKILLLTYTNTLTKYNTYLSEVMKIRNPEDIVTTALGFLETKLQEIEEGSELDFTLWNTWRKEFCPEFMDQYEFQNEVENFLWAMDISREEYLDEVISRKGMGKQNSR